MSKIPVYSKDFQIVIPTHNRPMDQNTLRAFPESMRESILVVTSLQEEADIIRKKYKHKLVYAIDDQRIDGIAKKRHFIMKNVGARKIFMLDDDCDFYTRCPQKYREYINGQWKIKPEFIGRAKFLSLEFLHNRHVEITFDILNKMMDDLAHTGIGSRMGNDKVEEVLKYNSRAMHAIGLNRDVYMEHGLKFHEVKMREDFNITLHLLKRGYPNAIFNEIVVAPKPYGFRGGCSSERTIEISNREAEKLAEIHPGLVKVVQKDYKGVTGTPRKEVIVQWKKSYDSYWNKK